MGPALNQAAGDAAAARRPRLRRAMVGASVALALVLVLVGSDAHAQPISEARIAVLLDGPGDRPRQVLQLTREELDRFGHGHPELFPADQVRTGDFSVETALQQLDDALADPNVDVIWAFGLLGSAAAVRRATDGGLVKPVVAPFVLEPSRHLLRNLDPARSNLAYVVLTPALGRDIEALRSVVPVRRLAYLLPRAIRDAIPAIEGLLENDASELGVELHWAGGTDAAALVRELPDDIDAVYVGPDPERQPADVEALSQALIARRLPSFSQVGRPEVELGLLMGLGGPENALRLARAVAVHTDAILQGEAPGVLDYAFQPVDQPVVNLVTAKALGLELSWSVLSEAEGLGKERLRNARKIGLAEIVREVQENNLQLRANAEDLIAAEQSVREAVGSFLPALDTSLSGTWNDPDAATGANPERSLAWSGNASQNLINEPVLAQVTINQHLRDATSSDNRTAVLDTTQSASIAYLNVLRALATEQIQRDNVTVTRTELAQARLRQNVGSGSRSEVVRLETQLANNRRSVIEAVASRNIAEIELLRLLNLSSEQPILPEDVSLESSRLMATGERLQRYMAGPDRFDVLRRFMAHEAVENSPELQGSESLLAAQRRQATSAQLAPFIPKVGVSGGVTHTFATAGAGTDEEAQAFFPLNPVSWQVGVTANLSLFEGGARYARTRREKAEARGQALNLEAQRIQIEASVRSALHRAGASYAAISLLRDAAEAANENLALVQQGYARGKENIITLVDAQNQALTSQLDANTAVYDFLVDLLEVQRAMGRFEFSMSDEAIDEFFERLQVFSVAEEEAHD